MAWSIRPYERRAGRVFFYCKRLSTGEVEVFCVQVSISSPTEEVFLTILFVRVVKKVVEGRAEAIPLGLVSAYSTYILFKNIIHMEWKDEKKQQRRYVGM